MKSQNNARSKEDASRVTLAPSHASEESTLHVERSETNDKKAKATVRRPTRAARKARKENATTKGASGHHRLDESSDSDNETEIQVGAYGIAGPQVVTYNHLMEADQTPEDGSNFVDDDVNARAMLVEANLAPEVSLAEEVNIQEEEKMILKKRQYKRALFSAMVLYGLSICVCIICYLFLFRGRPLVHQDWDEQFEAFVSASTAATLHFIATFVILIPTMRCCRASIRLEEYAPDDKQLLRDAQVASTVSLLLSVAALAILRYLPNLQWLGYAFMTWFFAGTVFASSRVHLLRRPKETRQKMPSYVWVLFVLFFLGLTGITIWVCYPVYPDCKVPYPFVLQNGYCDGEPYNSKECEYDGGDCINVFALEDYPNCTVLFPFLIGNGKCDGQVYGTVECGFDGGDCLHPVERCRGDNDCASEFCNTTTKVCDSDLYPDCYVENPNWIGDGECDGGSYASEACGFDGGDCRDLGKPCSQDEECASGLCNADTKVCYLGVLENYPDCIVDFPRKIGDGNCDEEYATYECGNDDGDCDVSVSASLTLCRTIHIAVIAILFS